MMKRLFSFLRPHLFLLIASIVGAVIAVFCMLLVPVLIGGAIDTFLNPSAIDWQRLHAILLQMVFAILGVVVFQGQVVYTTSRLSYATTNDLRDAAYEKLKVLPLSYIDSHPHGDLMSRIVNDCDAVGDGLLQGLQQFLTGILTVIGTLIFMFFISVPIAIIVIVITPLSAIIAWAITRASNKSFLAQQTLQGSLGAYAEEHFSNQKLISLFSYNKASIAGFTALNDKLYAIGEKAQFASSLSNPGTRFANNIVYAVVAVIGCSAVLTGFPGALTVGGIQSFLSYTTQYTKPFNDITSVLSQIQTAAASARRIFEFLDAPSEKPDAPDAIKLIQPVKGDISFRDVDFSYVSGTKFIEDVSWHAKNGQRIAVVGPTGCGKTTLINLLLRFYDIDAGRIALDSIDTQTIKRSSLRNAFGMVLQDTWLFEGTIKENIRYGKLDATDKEIHEAARSALAEDFILQLPQGYDTLIKGEGESLSEGQRQLLCIARVMLKNPPLLLLDEATSSIDTRTEIHVQDAFDKMIKGRTSLIVAHRLSTIRNATCILVMKDGKIIERGSHEELMAQGGFYKSLYESQWAQTKTEETLTNFLQNKLSSVHRF